MIMPAREPGEAEQPPRLFIAALEALLADLKAAGFDTAAIAAINTSGQQHGHVYLNAQAKAAFARLKDTASAESNLLNLLADSFAYGGALIWKTAQHRRRSRTHPSGHRRQGRHHRTRRHDIPLRFAATVHRVGSSYPVAYADTCHILQISSFVPAILAGDCTIPIDFGNACGTGLMNYKARAWDDVVMQAVAGDLPGGTAALAAKLPPIAHPLAAGTVATYFQISTACRPTVRSSLAPVTTHSPRRFWLPRPLESRHQLCVHDENTT